MNKHNITLDTPEMVDLESKRANQGIRFANYLIDLVVFYLIYFLIGVIYYIANPDLINSVELESDSNEWSTRLLTMLFYSLYMGSMEAAFKGKTLGKLITGTRAVNEDGSTLQTGKAFARGFIRAVPFCAFSALGDPCNPWQDRWTDTMVIKER